MNINASGSLLAQYTAADAVANTVFTAPAALQVEITRVIICNTSASPVAASLFHNDSGGALDASTALIFGKAVPANDYLDLRIEGANGGLHVKRGGVIGFTDASSGDLTISVYGITQQAVQGQR